MSFSKTFFTCITLSFFITKNTIKTTSYTYNILFRYWIYKQIDIYFSYILNTLQYKKNNKNIKERISFFFFFYFLNISGKFYFFSIKKFLRFSTSFTKNPCIRILLHYQSNLYTYIIFFITWCIWLTTGGSRSRGCSIGKKRWINNNTIIIIRERDLCHSTNLHQFTIIPKIRILLAEFDSWSADPASSLPIFLSAALEW